MISVLLLQWDIALHKSDFNPQTPPLVPGLTLKYIVCDRKSSNISLIQFSIYILISYLKLQYLENKTENLRKYSVQVPLKLVAKPQEQPFFKELRNLSSQLDWRRAGPEGNENHLGKCSKAAQDLVEASVWIWVEERGKGSVRK